MTHHSLPDNLTAVSRDGFPKRGERSTTHSELVLLFLLDVAQEVNFSIHSRFSWKDFWDIVHEVSRLRIRGRARGRFNHLTGVTSRLTKLLVFLRWPEMGPEP
jgi:hypothetical protein